MTGENKYRLHIKDVYKSYGPRLILDNIDLSVTSGELCSVVGPSGCGKSTLLRIILGQEQPDSGVVLVDGEPISTPDSTRGIVFQKYALFPHLTVLDNVLLGKKLSSSFGQWRLNKNSYKEEAVSLLKEMRLDTDLNKYPSMLSGGMQQRVAIAQALIMKPKILMMDEPFGALDPGTREDMQILLLSLWEKYKMTIFFVTHDLEEAVYLGTRILLISQYYSDARVGKQKNQLGAKIVGDYPLVREAQSTLIKSSAQFSELIREIRQTGFEPSYRKNVNEFNLTHRDSWRTLTEEELGRT
jgi:NitT/TauT family transport system ATP-binding protein